MRRTHVWRTLQKTARARKADNVDAVSFAHLEANLPELLAVIMGGAHEEGLDALREFLGSTSASGPGVVIATKDRLPPPAIPSLAA